MQMRSTPLVPSTGRRYIRAAAAAALALVCSTGAMMGLGGCSSGLGRIDSEISALLDDTSGDLGSPYEAPPPRVNDPARTPLDIPDDLDKDDETPPTRNPAVEQLEMQIRDEADDVLSRIVRRLPGTDSEAITFDLPMALAHAMRHSREIRFAEEQYIIATIQLLQERHLWGPRFFNDTLATIAADGDDGLYDTALDLVNDFSVTQRLPYGGEVSARAVARASQDLANRVGSVDTNSADIILAADIPLLRGAGMVARENRIQAERNLIYAAREFERFRRDFVVTICADYLDLVASQQAIDNAEIEVASLTSLSDQDNALYEAGRIKRFESGLTENRRAGAIDSLNDAIERYQLELERFKIRIGVDDHVQIEISRSELGIPVPVVDKDMAVRSGLLYRLDLQTARDRVADAQRNLRNAENGLLPDLDFRASAGLPTNPDEAKGDFDFSLDDANYRASLLFSLPLDREIERLTLRQAQITVERSIRAYQQFRDDVAVNVRAAARAIDAAQFSYDIQEQSVEVAREALASIEAAPDRTNSRDRADAVDDLNVASNALVRAGRDLQLATLAYLLETGQLRVDVSGEIQLPTIVQTGAAAPATEEADPGSDASTGSS